jgi:DNA (cytosine-5)-methyltransferase 1
VAAFHPMGPVIAGPGDAVNLCAGPGGWDLGARIIGLKPMVGVDLDPAACATARAAGFIRHQGDIRALRPDLHHGVTGAVVSAPCPPWSKSGRHGGDAAAQQVLDAITCFGYNDGCDCDPDEPCPCARKAPCGCLWEGLPHDVADPRIALVVETARWAMTAPRLQWFAAEQVAVPTVEYIWEDLLAEMYAAGWEYVNIFKVCSTAYGLPSRRPRMFLVGRRYAPSRQHHLPETPLGPSLSMGDALGWGPGVRVWTRNNRRPTGGNVFSADKPA